MNVIAPGFGYDVNRRAAGSAEISSVIAAVDLKFLHGILGHIQSYAARVIVHLSAVDGYAVAPTIAAIKRETALGRLLHAEILIAGEPGGIRYGRRQQGKGEIVAAID